MRFTKLLSAAGAVGIAGALALGTATTAQAVPLAAQSSDRIEGPLVVQNRNNGWGTNYASVSAPVLNEAPVRSMTDDLGKAASLAGVYNLPAQGSTGPIRGTGEAHDLCLQVNGTGETSVIARACDGSPAQQFTQNQFSNAYVSGYMFSSITTPTRGIGGGDLSGSLINISAAAADRFVSELTAPVVDVADLSAEVVSVDSNAGTAVVGGTGEPGAEIHVEGPDGTHKTIVNGDGTWQVIVPGLAEGDNVVKVTQIAGTDVQTTDLTVTVDAATVADLTAEVVSVDSDAKTAVVGGTGEPGAQIEVEGPDGTLTTTVDDDGNWQVTVPGLAEGDNPVKVTQTDGTDVQITDLTVTILPSPIVDPAIAGGAGVAAIAALGTVFMIRRKRATA